MSTAYQDNKADGKSGGLVNIRVYFLQVVRNVAGVVLVAFSDLKAESEPPSVERRGLGDCPSAATGYIT